MLNNIGVKLKNIINKKFSKAPPKHTIMAKGDSTASKKYWREKDIQFLADIKLYCDLSVTLPDGGMLKLSQKETRPLSS